MGSLKKYYFGKSKVSFTYANEVYASGTYGSFVGMTIADNGTKMYVNTHNSYLIRQFTLTTPYNVNTATFLRSSTISIIQSRCIFIKADGTKFFILDINGGRVASYDLTTAYNIATATNVSYSPTIPISYQALHITTDGTRLYTGSHKYTLTTPWDVTTAILDYTFGALVAPSFWMSEDGVKVFYTNGEFIIQLNLSVPYDMRTSSQVKKVDVVPPFTNIFQFSQLYVSPDGLKLIGERYLSEIRGFNMKYPFKI